MRADAMQPVPLGIVRGQGRGGGLRLGEIAVRGGDVGLLQPRRRQALQEVDAVGRFALPGGIQQLQRAVQVPVRGVVVVR